MEHRIIVTKTGCVSCFTDGQLEICIGYMKTLAYQKIAFTYEYA